MPECRSRFVYASQSHASHAGQGEALANTENRSWGNLERSGGIQD